MSFFRLHSVAEKQKTFRVNLPLSFDENVNMEVLVSLRDFYWSNSL